MGVFAERWVAPLAEALRALGSERAWVVHGSGLDEMTTTGETRYTLTSITFDGADRIAHLAIVSSNTIKQAPAGGGLSVTMEIHTASEGRMDVNVDRGIVLHTETESTIDGSSRVDGGQAAMPPMRMHGTTKMSADLTK